MDLILQTLVNATVASSFAAIFAVGLVLIFGVMNVCNFAQGELYMAGAFTVFYGYSTQELPYIAAVAIALVVVVGIGLLLEFTMFRWKRNDTMGALLLSCGALFVLQSVAIYFFGLGRMKTILPPYPGVIEIFYIDGLTIEYQRLIVFFTTAGLLGFFWLFLHLTRLGAALRACASDSEAAALQGISINKVALIAMALSAGMAGIAGAVMAPVVLVTPQMGGSVIIMAFIIIIVGGTGSVGGAVLAAILYTFFITFVTTYIDGETARILGYALMLVVLIVKPRGLVPGRENV